MASLVMASPIGRLELEEENAALVAVRFDARSPVEGPERHGSPVLLQAFRELGEYFAGQRRVFTVPLAPRGTLFQQRVWDRVALVEWGRTSTYAAIAEVVGLGPGASRAVGAANGANPLPIFIPCHRIVGSDGSLTGYAGGLERKATLLRIEGVRTEADQDSLF